MDVKFSNGRYWIHEVKSQSIYHLCSNGSLPALFCDDLERVFWPGRSIFFIKNDSLLVFKGLHQVKIFEVKENFVKGEETLIDFRDVETSFLTPYSDEICFILTAKTIIHIFKITYNCKKTKKISYSKLGERYLGVYNSGNLGLSSWNLVIQKDENLVLVDRLISDTWKLVEILLYKFNENFEFNIVSKLDCLSVELDYLHFVSPFIPTGNGYFFFGLSDLMDRKTLVSVEFDKERSEMVFIEEMKEDYFFGNVYRVVKRELMIIVLLGFHRIILSLRLKFFNFNFV